jgi:hypothetical protein
MDLREWSDRGADCRACRHFLSDPEQIERLLPGLSILSSAWGSTRGLAGICLSHDTWQDPARECPDFERPPAPPFPGGASRVT